MIITGNQGLSIKIPVIQKYDSLLRLRLIRRRFRRLLQSYRFSAEALAQSPVFFANSFPKSGTHLLTQILSGFTRIGPAVNSGLPAVITFRGDTGEKRSEIEIIRDLDRLLPGDIAYGHLHASPENVNFLCTGRFATYFILRDPRDVVISHAHYLTQMALSHIHHVYYKETLNNFDERVCTSIVGLQNTTQNDGVNGVNNVYFPDIRERFRPYMGWLAQPEVLSLHFEDFINQPHEMIASTLEHAVKRGFILQHPKTECIQTIAHGIDPKRSPTYRSGKIGEWRTGFSEQNKLAFKDVAGDLLVQLGYEKDFNW